LNVVMPKGGKRTGAGAPRGNLNALTHGRRSKQIEKAIENALHDPKGRVAVTTLVRKYHTPNER
jgi:uncharacterized protein YjcR